MKKKYIIILTLLFGIVIYMEGTRKEPLNWSISLDKNDKIPYGSFVTYALLNEIFPGSKIIVNTRSLYELSKNKNKIQENLIIINYSFNPDQLEIEKIYEFAENGNHILISATFFSKIFSDTLKIKTDHTFGKTFIPTQGINEHFPVILNPDSPHPDTFFINKTFSGSYFSSYDTCRSVVLGNDSSGRINFLRVKIGKGAIYLHSMPLLFSNYNQLYGSYRYAAKLLGFLPNQSTIWDEYYKPFKKQVASPVRYILSQPSLKAAYILLILGLLIYILFEAKRKQRIIPIIKPPVNTSAEFTETVGKLYFNHADHRDIAIKKFSMFCEMLRTKFNIQEIKFEEEFYKKLSDISGVDLKIVTTIFLSASFHKTTTWITDKELIRFNKLLEKFNFK